MTFLTQTDIPQSTSNSTSLSHLEGSKPPDYEFIDPFGPPSCGPDSSAAQAPAPTHDSLSNPIAADAQGKQDAAAPRPVCLSVGNQDACSSVPAADAADLALGTFGPASSASSASHNIVSGAPPSNTAPANCMEEENENIKVLRMGIDSLYLSYSGSLNLTPSLELAELKRLAQSNLEGEKAQAVYPLLKHFFEVKDKGAGRFPYVLSDNAYRINLSGFGTARMPLASVQIKSDWLVSHGVIDAVAILDDLIAHFGEFEETKVSRADIFVDFVCHFPFESLPVSAWVTRAHRIDSHNINHSFTGLSMGLGGHLSARLYDKTQEVKKSGKEYLCKLWLSQGWDGKSPVWRLEFQFKRPSLVELGSGSVIELLDRLGALWRYATLSWLKLTIPNPLDQTQSRWPLHPIWAALADINWLTPDPGTKKPVRACSPPSNRQLFINGLAGITSFMGREGINDPDEAFERFKQDAEHFHEFESDYSGVGFKQYLRDKAAAKARRYNVPFPDIIEKSQVKTAQVVATAYRKAKEGE